MNKLKLFIIFLVIGSTAWAAPQRIISTMPSVTEMLFALDLGDRVVGVTSNCNYPLEAKKKEKIGGFFLNLEKVVSLKPDLVVMLEDAQKRDVEKFRNFGLPVFTINPHSVTEVMDSLLKLGDATGKKWKAEQLVSAMKSRIAAVKPRRFSLPFVLKLPKVLAVVGYRPLIVVGGVTFIDDIIRNAGAENVAGKTRAAYPHYSFEELMRENPEYIIVAEGAIGKEEIKNDRRWQCLDAVKQGSVLFMNADVLSRPGPRVVDAIEGIARFINEKKT